MRAGFVASGPFSRRNAREKGGALACASDGRGALAYASDDRVTLACASDDKGALACASDDRGALACASDDKGALVDMIYHEQEIREHYHKLTKLLIEKNYTITTMESATSGQIASLITDTEGSSAVLKGAFVTYCNEAKIMQGVPAEIIERYTVYSRETAEAMARACMKAYGAQIGIGVTGTMGNVDPANQEASVPGQVYFAIGMELGEEAEDKEGLNSEARTVDEKEGLNAGAETEAGRPVVESFHLELAPQPSRLMYKLAVAEEVYKVLIEKLM